jgi:tetratricopeptide (TPR) repeat protein
MNNRLNTKFIVILSSVLIVLCAGVALVAWVAISGDAERHAEIGRTAEKAGDYKEAIARYGRSIGKDPMNLSYYDDYERALLQIVPETRTEARERYNQQYLGLLSRRIGISQENPESRKKLIDAYRERAEVMAPNNQNDIWNSVQQQSTQMIDDFKSDDGAVAYARPIRIDAMSRRKAILKSAETDQFNEDCAAFVAAESTDPVGWEGILRAKYEDSRDYWSRGDKRLLDLELSDPEEGFDVLVEKMNTGGVQLTPQILRYMYLRELLEEEPDEQNLEAIQAQALDIGMASMETLLASDDPAEVVQAQNMIRDLLASNLIDRKISLDFVLPLIEGQKLPLDINLMICQAYLLASPEVARLAAEQVLSKEPLPVGLYSTVQPVARSEAALAMFDVEFARLTTQLSEMDSPKDLDVSDLQGYQTLAIESFQGDPNQDSVKLYTQGTIDMLSDNVQLARAKFMEISKSPFVLRPGMQQRFLPRFITTASLSGERGVAVDVLGEYLATISDTQALGLRTTYAEELIKLGRVQDATAQVSAVLESEPENPRALAVLSDIQESSGSIGTILRDSRTDDDRAYQRIMAAVQAGNLNDARELLLVMVDRSDDLNYKRVLVIVNAQLGLEEEARQILKEYPELAAEPRISQIMSLIEIEDPMERISLSVKSTYSDVPTQNAMRFILLNRYAGSGLPDASRAVELIPAALEPVLEELPPDSSTRRTLLTSALGHDLRVGLINTPECMSDKIMAGLELIEDDEVQLANMRAILAATAGNPQMAIKLTDPVIERNIGNDQTWLIRSLALKELGRNDEAISAIKKAYGRSPNTANYIKLLAQWLTESGERGQALEALRTGIRSPLTRGILLNDWLLAESNDGNMAAALMERQSIFDDDVKDGKGLVVPVYDVFNAVELARLLISVPPTRLNVLTPRGTVKYSPGSWTGLTQKQRRTALSEARLRRQKEAFAILDTVEKSARNDRDVVMTKFARISANQLINKIDVAKLGINSLITCCNEKLTPQERIRITELMAQLDMDELVAGQMEILAADEQLAVRRAAYDLGARLQWDGSSELAESIAVDSGSTADRLNLVRSALLGNDLERAEVLLAEIMATDEFSTSTSIRSDVLLYDADYNARKAQALLNQVEVITEQLSRATADGNNVEITRLEGEQARLRSEAKEFFVNATDLAGQAYESRPSDPRALYLRHLALQSMFQLDPESSTRQDMVANAQAAIDLAPTEWTATNCLVKAQLLSGNSREALAALDKYFRAGGLSPQARNAMLQVAVSNGTPGQAIPSLKLAMEREPMNPEWPRVIGRLLAIEEDPVGASDMWWKVLELDESPEVIETFVELEFRRDEPNVKRLKEAFEIDPQVTRSSPEMRAAMAAALSMDGEKRKAERIFKDAYLASKKKVREGADQILLDRVLVYFFRLESDETLEASEIRLRSITGGEMGAHEYGALAVRAMAQAGPRSGNIKKAIEYLTQSINQSGTEENYRKALMQNLSTALYLDNRCSDAIAVLEELASMGNPQPATLNNLAYMLVDCENKPESAIVHSTLAVRGAPNEASFLDTHGYTLYRLGRFADAEKFLSRSVILGPSASNLLHLAQVFHATGQNARALSLIEKIGNDFPRLSPEKQAEVEALLEKVS